MPTNLQDRETGKVLPWQHLLQDIAKKSITHKLTHAITPPNLPKPNLETCKNITCK